MENKYTVFISSTYEDLKEERSVAVKAVAVIDAECFTIALEHSSADSCYCLKKYFLKSVISMKVSSGDGDIEVESESVLVHADNYLLANIIFPSSKFFQGRYFLLDLPDNSKKLKIFRNYF